MATIISLKKLNKKNWKNYWVITLSITFILINIRERIFFNMIAWLQKAILNNFQNK